MGYICDLQEDQIVHIHAMIQMIAKAPHRIMPESPVVMSLELAK
jgi:hypothetical protein